MIICKASKVLAGIIPNNYPPTPLKGFPHCLKAGTEISLRVQMDGGNKHEIKQRCFEPIHIGQQTCTQTISARRE